MTSTEDRRLLVDLRRDLLRLLAGLFLGPPSSETARALSGADAVSVVHELGGPAASTAVRSLAAVEDTAELRREFFELLSVPTPRYVAPFESVYCDEREVDGRKVGGLLAGPSAEAVRRSYARHGFEVVVPELPDHLGCELAFLAQLCDEEARALDRGDLRGADARREAGVRFAREHPQRWLGLLRDRLAADPSARFYPAVAALAAALVDAQVAGPAGAPEAPSADGRAGAAGAGQR